MVRGVLKAGLSGGSDEFDLVVSMDIEVFEKLSLFDKIIVIKWIQWCANKRNKEKKGDEKSA